MEELKYLTKDNPNTNTKGVKKLLQKHKINKVSGQDDLPAHIHRETATELASITTAIFNQSL